MKQVSPQIGPKQQILKVSLQQKLKQARSFRSCGKFDLSIQSYHKVLFLSQKPQYLIQLGQIYQVQLMDISSAILFYRRSLVIMSKQKIMSQQSKIKQKLKQLNMIRGLQILALGGCKNLLQGLEYADWQQQVVGQFKKIYPDFHKRLISTYIKDMKIPGIKFINSPIKQSLQTCLAFLQVNSRENAFGQLQNCRKLDQNNVDIMILKGLLYWAMLENQKAYKQFWEAYKINQEHKEVLLFIRLIMPKVQSMYKQAKYQLIESNIDKCKLKVSRGLQMHPYHTQLLILKGFLHRQSQQYKQALLCLQVANQHLNPKQPCPQLQSQISLTYNQMAIFLFKQQKYSQAIDLFTQGLTFRNDYGLYTNRGDCYRAMNHFVKALQDYLKAYQLKQDNQQLNFRISNIYSIRGVSLFNSKNYQLALKQFEQSLKYTPKNQQFILSKAKCLIQMDRRAQATEILTETLRLNSNYNQLKAFYLQIKEPDEKRGPNNRKIIQISKEKN